MGGYDNGSGRNKKKISILALSSILLVAMVVGVVVGVTRNSGSSNSGNAPAAGSSSGISTTSKAIKAICQPTDYKETCENSLASAKNTSDPRELIKVAFNSAVENIQDAINNSSVLREAAKDPKTSQAFETCKELLGTSIDDLKRSFDKVGAFDMSKLDDYVADLKTWLSGAITYQETCLDGFENTTGDSGEKMKKLLKISGELTSNGLAMVTDISSLIGELPMFSRRLLEETSHDDYLPYPSKIQESKKRVLEEEENTGRRLHEEGLTDYPGWVDDNRRTLLVGDPKTLKPNAVVAQDGSGTFKTINDAVKTIPKKSNRTFVVLIKAGTYKEYIDIPRHVNDVVFIGEGQGKTIITGNKNYVDGVGTYRTATVAVNGDRFLARDITFENTAGPMKHQAVALRVSGDMAIFYNCAMDAYQDTLYTHSYRQYYRECNISGTIDFIFGDAAVVFQKCKMIVRKPLENQACMVTAQGRKDHRSLGGIILQGCTITAEKAFMTTVPLPKSYLGRPWKEFSRTIIMQSFIDSNIDPEGWSPWAGTYALDTSYYAEFNNRGPGANLAKRVTWKGIKKISPQEAESFTPGKHIQGDLWIKPTGLPYDSGMMKV